MRTTLNETPRCVQKSSSRRHRARRASGVVQFEHELRIFDDAVGLIFEWYGNEFNLCQHDTDDAPNAGSDNNEQRYFVEAR